MLESMSPERRATAMCVGQSDFVKVDCTACHHVVLLSPEFLLRLGLSPCRNAATFGVNGPGEALPMLR